jgi:integrase
MQHVNRVRELRNVYHSKRPGLIPNPDLPHTRSHADKGFPVVRIPTTLNHENLVARARTRLLGKGGQVLLGATDKPNGLHGMKLYVYSYVRACGLRIATDGFDLRHTWASWHVQRGTPLYVVQKMGAWESEGMVRRYAHLAPSHLRQHAEVLTEVLNGTITAQPGNEKGASA